MSTAGKRTVTAEMQLPLPARNVGALALPAACSAAAATLLGDGSLPEGTRKYHLLRQLLLDEQRRSMASNPRVKDITNAASCRTTQNNPLQART